MFIYKINSNDNFSELLEDYEFNLINIYNDVKLNTPELRSDLHRSSYLSFFENMIDYHQASANELFDCFYLSDEKRQKEFLEKYAQEVEVKVPIDKEIYTKAYRNASFSVNNKITTNVKMPLRPTFAVSGGGELVLSVD